MAATKSTTTRFNLFYENMEFSGSRTLCWSIIMIVCVSLPGVFCNEVTDGTADDLAPLVIEPISPVRFRGESAVITVTGPDFLNDYGNLDFYCEVKMKGGEAAHIHKYKQRDLTVNYTTEFPNLQQSGEVTATIDKYPDAETLTKVATTEITVIEDSGKRTILEEGKDGSIPCLEQSGNHNQLKFQWFKDNMTVHGGNRLHLSVNAVKDDVTANFTCVIATQDAVNHYGSVFAAYNATSGTSARRQVSVVSIDRVELQNGTVNVTVDLSSDVPLNMTVLDAGGQLLASGYQMITMTVNATEVVFLEITDISGVLFRRKIAKEVPATQHEPQNHQPSVVGPVVGILLAILVVAVVAFAVAYKKSERFRQRVAQVLHFCGIGEGQRQNPDLDNTLSPLNTTAAEVEAGQGDVPGGNKVEDAQTEPTERNGLLQANEINGDVAQVDGPVRENGIGEH